jgi:hypothetical protein
MAEMAVKAITELLSALSRGGVLRRAETAYVLTGLRGPRRKISPRLADALLARGLIKADGGGLVLARAGEEWLVQGRYAEQHQILSTARITGEDGQPHFVVVDIAESPLALLYRLKWIGPAELEAGEKLRRDYTIGQLTARMGVDYEATAGARGSHRPDLADTTLAARQRFNRALKAAGPGLGDLLFDVCCYLKGLEESEKARAWPRGSAKVVLRLGLERLAGHYGFGAPQHSRSRAWTAQDETGAKEKAP